MSATIIEFPRTAKQKIPEGEGKSYREHGRAEIELPHVLIEMLFEIFNSLPPSPEQIRRERFLLECD